MTETSHTPTEPAGGDAPSLSVVVCTRNRPGALAGCLDALARLERPPDEVVVVDASDGAERDRVADAVRPAAGRLPARPLLFFRDRLARTSIDRLPYGWATLGALLLRLHAPHRRGLRGAFRGYVAIVRHAWSGRLPDRPTDLPCRG